MQHIPNRSVQDLSLPNTYAPPRRVLELFAGVGGFRYGLEQCNNERAEMHESRAFDVVWANQFEPSSKLQHAARVYEARWGDAPVTRDLAQVVRDPEELARIDALAPDMLVGGFPCQDYSVAKPANASAGIEGKKGVLWWSIYELLQRRAEAGQPIGTLLLENVDRLLASPSASRGRDFAIILASLQQLGYAVAWQVVNAADYGLPQRRRRVFIVAVHQHTLAYRTWVEGLQASADVWLTKSSPLARALPVRVAGALDVFALPADVHDAQAEYQPDGRKTRFANVGVCIGGAVYTQAVRVANIADYTPWTGRPQPLTLGDVIAHTGGDVPEKFFLHEADLAKWVFLKGAKATPRVSQDGHAYEYTEGAVAFPDPLDKASRTSGTVSRSPGPMRS